MIHENNQKAEKTWTYSYDAAGNILSKTEYAFTTGTLGTALDTIPYTYGDSTWGDLLTAHDGNAISYDNIGNPENDGTWTYTWEHGRQLASMTAEDLDGMDTNTTVTYTYDANGMRTGKVVTKNDYHTHSYTETVTEPTCTEDGYTTYTCACGDSYTGNIKEALGHYFGKLGLDTQCSRCGERRSVISPIVPPTDPPISTASDEVAEAAAVSNGTPVASVTSSYSYVYNGSSLSQMTVVTEATADGTTTTTTDTLYFTYDASGTPQTVTYNDTVYYYSTNLQGDVVAILNSAGTAVVTYTYDAWGSIVSIDGSLKDTLGVHNPLTYRGYVYDAETELYYLQSRYYNPDLGRFINADGNTSTGQGLLGHNMFAYCRNNPVNRSDPTGEIDWDSLFEGVGLLSVGITACIVAATVVSGGACLPLLVVAGATFMAGGMTVANGAAEVIESVTGNNFMRDTVYEGNEPYYEKQKIFFETVAEAGTAALSMKSGSTDLCFIAGTVILAEEGRKAIQEIQKGDYVWSWDEETGDVTLKKVVETYVNETRELVHVFINGEEIVATPSHPFYSPVKGWTDAIKLRAGDILVLVNGEYVVVEKVQHEILEAYVTVYNFQVEDSHTYYVTDTGVLVYNRCGSNHGNSLATTKPAEGYILRDKDTYEILKYGETTRGYNRYTRSYLDRNNAFMDFVTKGTKAEMHKWQHDMIVNYVSVAGHRPPFNLNLF